MISVLKLEKKVLSFTFEVRKREFQICFFTIVDKYFMSLNYIQILIQIKEQQDRQEVFKKMLSRAFYLFWPRQDENRKTYGLWEKLRRFRYVNGKTITLVRLD